MAVPVPLRDLLTYRVPDGWDDPPKGGRVVVPLGARVVTGCVVESVTPAKTPAKLRELLEAVDDRPLVPAAVMRLALWAADYYVCGPGEVLSVALPSVAAIGDGREVRLTAAGRRAVEGGTTSGRRNSILRALQAGRPRSRAGLLRQLVRETAPGAAASGVVRRGPKPRRAAWTAALAALVATGLVEVGRTEASHRFGFHSVPQFRITGQGGGVLTAGADGRRVRVGARQRQALEAMRDAGDWIDQRALAARGVSVAALARLGKLGWATRRVRSDDRVPLALDAAGLSANAAAPPRLTAEQSKAVERLDARLEGGGFHVGLLHGVTGSGKTEVYLRLAATAQRQGRQVLVLVPEIGLTPAAVAAFRNRFGDRVAIQHSGLSVGERHDQWHRIRDGLVDIVVGTRSAVFAPLTRLGLIVVDEEHDASFKQEDAPRYHGRDVAIMRGKRAGALVVLGSATPSLESYQQATRGRYELIRLTRRALGRALPSVRVIDMKMEFADRGSEAVLSRPLEAAIQDRIDRREQVLILLNRRGFAAAVLCRGCGSTAECPNCSVSLTVHRATARVRCHYCGYAKAVPERCPTCGGSYLEWTGVGTERVEAEVRRSAPTARVARMDRDTMRRRGAAESLLRRFARHEVDVLVGTQMIAKGHDFPKVTLVGVVSADVGLGVPDFRAAERTFQLLTQVAGRAGRGERAGESIVQTLHPGHYSVVHACAQDFEAFYREELDFRRAMRYPPCMFLVNLIVRGGTQAVAMEEAAGLARRLRQRMTSGWVLGPAPAPLGRLKGAHRVQVLVKGQQRGRLREAVALAIAGVPGLDRRLSVDVDPVSVR